MTPIFVILLNIITCLNLYFKNGEDQIPITPNTSGLKKEKTNQLFLHNHAPSFQVFTNFFTKFDVFLAFLIF